MIHPHWIINFYTSIFRFIINNKLTNSIFIMSGIHFSIPIIYISIQMYGLYIRTVFTNNNIRITGSGIKNPIGSYVFTN